MAIRVKLFLITTVTYCLSIANLAGREVDTILLKTFESSLQNVGDNVELPVWRGAVCFNKNPNERIMNALATYLNQNENLNISIVSHVDCRGNKEYNEEYTTHFSESLAKLLSVKGVKKERINAEGHGGSNPLIDCECDECIEEEHRKNRRTEIVITKN